MRPPPRRETPALLRRTAELAIEYLASLPERPVRVDHDVAAIRSSLIGPLPEDGEDPLRVIEDLVAKADRGIVAMAGPRYFGFVIGGSLPAAVAADWMTSAWDQNAGIYVGGPAASVVEEAVGGWLIDLFGLPAGSGFGLTTGCQMANFACLAAARHAVLARRGWSVEERGLYGSPEIDVIVGDEAHATLFTALQYLGLGRDRVIRVETDPQGRIRADALRAALPDHDRPLIVCLQAGNVNTGAFDPFDPVIDAVRERDGAWVHIDGAFGLWAATSPDLRSLLAGAERADSWATDGHKSLNVPYDAGFAFVADPTQHAAALAPPSAAYIELGESERDEFQWVPEYSRRARGFTSYAALRSLGRSGVREMVEQCCAVARRIAEQLAANEGVSVLNDVAFNQVLVHFDPPSGTDDGAFTRQVTRRVQEDGTCWLSGTTWHGTAAMRVSVSNWSTTAADADRTVEAILRCAREAALADGRAVSRG